MTKALPSPMIRGAFDPEPDEAPKPGRALPGAQTDGYRMQGFEWHWNERWHAWCTTPFEVFFAEGYDRSPERIARHLDYLSAEGVKVNYDESADLFVASPEMIGLITRLRLGLPAR